MSGHCNWDYNQLHDIYNWFFGAQLVQIGCDQFLVSVTSFGAYILGDAKTFPQDG